MKKVQQDYIKYYFRMTAFFLISIVCCLLIFFYRVQKDLEENVRLTLTNNVQRQSQHLQSILEAQYDYLESTAAFLGNSDELLSEENMELIRCVRKTTDLERLCIVDTNGQAHYDTTDEAKSVASRRYFKEGMAGKRTLSDPLESKLDGTTRVVLGVPIFRNNQVIGVLGGSYDVTALSWMLFDDIYKGEGFSLILMKDGSIVSYKDTESFLEPDTESNFFDYYKINLGKQNSLNEIMSDFSEEKGGYTQISNNGKLYHMVYEPLGYNKWMVCYAVPVHAAKEAYQFITNNEILLTLGFCLLVLIFFWIILRINHKQQKELIQYANTDSLTGLSNKKSTEEAIQNWMEHTKGQLSGIQAFIIMDIDYFKQINDKYGHAAGDEVLHRIGRCLKKTFRDFDIIGRIGGDEFVIFLKNVSAPQDAEKKAAELAVRISQLDIPELKGQKVTCSIGMSYAQNPGDGYLTLYKHADMALYETKEKGRNGYTVYSSEHKEFSSDNYVHKAYTEIHPLTGLYYNKAFFRKADAYLKEIANNTHMMAAIDIEHFRLFNQLYGRKEGDRLLIYIAEYLKNLQEKYHGIVGYLNGDNFCIILPDQKTLLHQIQKDIEKRIEEWTRSSAFLPGFGVYRIEDTSVPAVIMYDRATLALSHVYGNYVNRICTYNPDMEKKIEDEIALVSEIQEGLKNQEFIFYVQPQCHVSPSGIQIVGGECLVRWKHKEKGIISPSAFIPVLEKNGFITELDCYLWKKVCKWLKSWIDRGYTPVPISINVSRIDILSIDVPKYLKNLVTRYQLSPELLKIEILESAYGEDEESIRQTVAELRADGFSVMMDDFGSGYSSLNMLKNITIDVIKLDARFLEFDKQEENRGVDILESVFSMSRQIGLPIIVEGVETEQQEKCLLDLGCRYAQGYYYYPPMPLDEFEQLISDPASLDLAGFTASQINNMRHRELLNINIITDNMMNNMLGASAFYEVFNSQLKITSVNEQYCRLAGISYDEKEGHEKQLANHVVEEEQQELLALFQKAFENPVEGSHGYLHYRRADGKVHLIYFRIFFLREREGHRMFYGSLTDLTSLSIGTQTENNPS